MELRGYHHLHQLLQAVETREAARTAYFCLQIYAVRFLFGSADAAVDLTRDRNAPL
jgi:hypothetical protein